MGSRLYNHALKTMADRTVDWTGTLKVMLVNDLHEGANPVRDFLTSGGGGSASSNEYSGGGYAGGFSGSGRQSVTLLAAEQDSNNRAILKFSVGSLTWPALNGSDTIQAAIVYKPVTSDSNSLLFAYLELATPLTPSGQDVVLNLDTTNGDIRIVT